MTTVIELPTSETAAANKSFEKNKNGESENESPPAKRVKMDGSEEEGVAVVGVKNGVSPAKPQTMSGGNKSEPVHVGSTNSGNQGEKMDTSNNGGAAGAPSGGNSDDVLDKNLYSRQIYTLGESAMVNLRTASVLISGLGSVGVEIAKNLILGGVRHVTIQDTKLTKWSDLSAQYYLREADVGHNRAAACFERLAELNDSVNVELVTQDLTETFVSQFDLVVLTDASRSAQRQVAAWTRAHGRRVLIADARGVFSYIFNDFGDNFRIDDATGEQSREFFIEHIDKTTGEVTTLENLFHGLEDGDHVTFSEVKGLDGINGCEPIKITVKNASKFNIGDVAASFPDYIEGGRCRQVKVPITVSHLPFEKSIVEPEFVIWDYAKFEYPAQLHALWTALYAFEEKHDRSPVPRSTEDVALLKELIPEGTEEIPEKLIEMFSFSASGNLVTVSSVVGGIAAQEAMKGVTHHLSPLKQWLHLDHVEALPGDWTAFDNAKLSESDCQPRQSRYDGQAAVFGWPYQECLFRQRWFVVGAGAIGCELLKNLAMMGVACGEGGLIKITDMDQIEISNLNRQFLFRRRDVGGKKSECAARAVTSFNADVRIEALADRVGPDTEHIFNDDFFGELNGVANALDNVDARRYMDRRCVYYRLPLLESGTMGTKGNTQVVYPFLTESYSSSVDPPEKEIPVCTLKNFPNEIQHTIQWAREQFETFFVQPAEQANQFLNDERGFNDHVSKLSSGQQIEILQKVKAALIDNRPTTGQDCIVWARQQFQELYHNTIAQMLHSFPPDQLTDSGAKFWSGAKRCPHVLNFDPSKEEHFDFVYAASLLIAQMYGVEPVLCREEFVRIALSVHPEPFQPRVVTIATTEAEAAAQKERGASSLAGDDDTVIEQLWLRLATLNVTATTKLNPVDFEKDDDSNHHMEFITAASNLRASNYDIQHADRMKTKQIAGKIIPAIATTTAAVAGLVCIELYKVIDAKGVPKTPIDRFKNTFLNLSMPFFSSAEPIAAPKRKYLENEFTLWDRIDIAGPLTLEEFVKKLEADTGLELSMLSVGQCLVFSFFMNAAKKAERFKTEVKAIYEELLKKKLHESVRAIVLEPMMTDKDGEDVDTPYIRYTIA